MFYSNNMSNKSNKRARSSSPNDYREQHTEYAEYNINFTLNSSLDVLMCEKENKSERNTYLETEQTNAVRYFLWQGCPLYYSFNLKFFIKRIFNCF